MLLGGAAHAPSTLFAGTLGSAHPLHVRPPFPRSSISLISQARTCANALHQQHVRGRGAAGGEQALLARSECGTALATLPTPPSPPLPPQPGLLAMAHRSVSGGLLLALLALASIAGAAARPAPGMVVSGEQECGAWPASQCPPPQPVGTLLPPSPAQRVTGPDPSAVCEMVFHSDVATALAEQARGSAPSRAALALPCARRACSSSLTHPSWPPPQLAVQKGGGGHRPAAGHPDRVPAHRRGRQDAGAQGGRRVMAAGAPRS